MKFERFWSASPQTPYAPTWDFRVGTSLCSDIDTNSLSKFLLKKEKEIKSLPSQTKNDGRLSDGFTGLGKNSTTSKFRHYNVLSWNNSEIKKLKKSISKNIIDYNRECGNGTPRELWIQCWYNVLRFSQKINPHHHSTDSHCYLSGHFNVQVEKTSTVYMSPINQINDPEVVDINNKNGEMTLFPSYIFHYTTPHYSINPRITIAFDVNLYQRHPNCIRL